MIFSPGATRSGFSRPSPVGPFEEKYEIPKECGADLCAEPTAMRLFRIRRIGDGKLQVDWHLVRRYPASPCRSPSSRRTPPPQIPDLTVRRTSWHRGLWPQPYHFGSNG